MLLSLEKKYYFPVAVMYAERACTSRQGTPRGGEGRAGRRRDVYVEATLLFVPRAGRLR